MATIALFLCMISCTVVANLLLKLGASDPKTAFLVGVASWRTFLGLTAFGIAAILYTFVLKVFPLNLAQSFTALQFIAVICAASLILGEPISVGRWVGISLIAAGIAVVAVTDQY
jgi:multidrug transporter EmrE-like cation transporter